LNGCLLTRDGASALLLSGGEVDRAGLSMTWADEVRQIPIVEARQLIFATVEQTVKPLLERFGLDGGRIGIDEAEFAMVQALGQHCPGVTLEDGDQAYAGFAQWSGTSFAAASVSGAIAARTVPGQTSARQAWDALREGSERPAVLRLDR
jgi:hypothetical protein